MKIQLLKAHATMAQRRPFGFMYACLFGRGVDELDCPVLCHELQAACVVDERHTVALVTTRKKLQPTSVEESMGNSHSKSGRKWADRHGRQATEANERKKKKTQPTIHSVSAAPECGCDVLRAPGRLEDHFSHGFAMRRVKCLVDLVKEIERRWV